jgi:hypothetical protein
MVTFIAFHSPIGLSARASAALPVFGAVGVPDLHLREVAQVDARVAARLGELPVDEEFEVAVRLLGGQMHAVAIGHELAGSGIDAPVLVAIGVPLGLLGSSLVGRELRLDVRTEYASAAGAAAPASEILAVEQRCEAGGRH